MSAVISCGIPIAITSIFAIFAGIFSLNKGISFEAETHKNIYFIKAPIIIPKYLPYLPCLLKITKLRTNSMLPIIINGIKGPKATGSCPVSQASSGVKEPTNTP